MLIKITQQDIDRGDPGNALSCPIALAIKRDFPGEKVKVASSRIEIGDVVLVLNVNSSSIKVYDFIEAFDMGLPVAPFEVDLKF
jgi:hypothetical protein